MMGRQFYVDGTTESTPAPLSRARQKGDSVPLSAQWTRYASPKNFSDTETATASTTSFGMLADDVLYDHVLLPDITGRAEVERSHRGFGVGSESPAQSPQPG
jgi:hypothetical protein